MSSDNSNTSMFAVAYVRSLVTDNEIHLKLVNENLEEAKSLQNAIDTFSGGMFSATIKTRNYFYEKTLEKYKDNYEQLLILSIGLDVKAHTFSFLNEKLTVGLDLKSAEIIEIFNAAKIPPKAKYVSCNFNDLDEKEFLADLKSIGFDISRPTFIIWEGGTYYLEKEIVFRTLNFLFEKVNIWGLGMDVLNSYFFGNNDIPGKVENVLNVLKSAKEPWKGFFDKEELETYFEDKNFDSVKIETHGSIEKQISEIPVVSEELIYFVTAHQ